MRAQRFVRMTRAERLEAALAGCGLLCASGAFTALIAHPSLAPGTARSFDLVLAAPTLVTALWLVKRHGAEMRDALSRHATLVGLLAFVLLSALWSVTPRRSVEEGLRLLAATCLAWVLGRGLKLADTARVLAVSLGITLLLSGLLVAMDPASGVVALQGRPAAWRGVFDDKNGLGFVAALTLLLGAIGSQRADLRPWVVPPMLLSLPFLAFCRSAGAVLGVGVGLTCVAALAVLRHLRTRRARLGWLGAIALLTALVGSPIGGRLVMRGLGRDLTLTTRAQIWVTVLPWLRERPILGYGYRGFWAVAQAPIRERLILTPDEPIPAGHPGHSHSGFLETVADLGLLGGLLLTAHIAVSLWRAAPMACSSSLSAWPLVTLVVIVMHNLVETSFLRSAGAGGVAWLVFMVAAFAARGPTSDAPSAQTKEPR